MAATGIHFPLTQKDCIMPTFLYEDCYLPHTPTADVAGGAVVVLGSIAGIAPRPIVANTLGSVAIDGVFGDVPKATGSGTDYAVGTRVMWYATSGIVSTTTGVNFGFIAEKPATTDAVCKVALFAAGS